MSKYYIIDSTIKKSGKNPVLLFETIASTVKYLEGMCQRQMNLSRAQYMQNCEELGHGADESTGRAFFDQMEQYFNVGIIRSDSKPMKCNIFEAVKFSREKPVHGD